MNDFAQIILRAQKWYQKKKRKNKKPNQGLEATRNETRIQSYKAAMLLTMPYVTYAIITSYIIFVELYTCLIVSSMRRRGRPQQSWNNQVTDFMGSRNIEEDMVEDRHLWCLGVDGWLLAVQILIIIYFFTLTLKIL